jgi:hypothetical protein
MSIQNSNSKSTQVEFTPQCEVENLRYHCKVLNLKLKRMTEKYNNCLSKLKDLEVENGKNSKFLKLAENISEGVQNNDEKAIFLTDVMKNFCRKNPRWSETSIRLCTIWRFCSPKGYEFCRKHLVKLPSKMTISRYLGPFNSSTELTKKRLTVEIAQLKNPVERICSLIIDDMSIKEKMCYSRSEDCIYGLSSCKTDTVGEKPDIANKMLCYVIHGLSTRYTIPAGYFFHASLTPETYHKITLNILELLTTHGFIVLRIVTDDFSANVKLFKTLCNGNLTNSIPHPFLAPMPLFLSFDFCHALKNARNLFLDREMYSSEGLISSDYLKKLYALQKDLPVKPIRYLTKKHLYPTNFEKMNVLRAIHIFSPAVSSSLKFLQENKHPQFQNVNGTIKYIETLYIFFQIHNVSSRNYYIRSLNSAVAPYIDISDERLHWLNVTFPNYIEDIQNSSFSAGLQGLTKETAHALIFTSRSTFLCVKFLLQQSGFYYVLTRSFSSDAVEGMFSHVRLRGGSNDATDARTAEYALRQILRCGIVKASKSSNTATNIDYVSSATITKQNFNPPSDLVGPDIVLPFNVLEKIRNLSNIFIPDNTIYTASIAFIAGYILKKLNETFHCDTCLSLLVSTSIPGPLLRLIWLQDRGGLTYPNNKFVGLLKKLADIATQILPHLSSKNPCQQLLTTLHPHLIKNSIFSCDKHKDKFCKVILQLLMKPILNNICLEKTDYIKTKSIHNKPISRKVLKL